MDQVQLINQLTQRLITQFTTKETEIKQYLDDEVTNSTPVPSYTALREPQFYLQVYSKASTDFNICSNHRITIGKLLIDVNSAITNLSSIKTNVTLVTSSIKQLNSIKDRITEYQRLLEIHQRSIDTRLRYFSSVQYVVASPHFLQQ